MKPVGQFDKNHPGILDHPNDHVPVVGLESLLFRKALVELADLGDAENDLEHFLAEHPLDIVLNALELLGVLDRILDYIVQQPRGDGFAVQIHLGEEDRDGYGVREVGLATLPLLPFMPLSAVDGGALDKVDVLRLQRRGVAVDDVEET